MIEPTKSVPGGCIVALFGVFSLCYSTFVGYILIKAIYSTKKDTSVIIRTLSINFGVSLLLAIILLWAGYKLAVQTGAYDPWDQDEPKIKF